MDAASPFAQSPLTPEPIIAQVCRQLRAESGDDGPPGESLVDGMVDRVVRELWSGRVKTFVPILALRETRQLLRDARATASADAEPRLAPTAQFIGPEFQAAHLGRHAAARRDALAVDRRDALRVDDDVLSL